MHTDFYTVKEAKEQEYRNYINEHIKNVQTTFKNLVSCKDIIEYLQSETWDPLYLPGLSNSIKEHDISKFGPYEFDQYRKEYYPVNDEEKQANKKDYDEAWIHHYTINKHHWDSWKTCPDLMPMNCVIEMLCDWFAMSIKFGGKTTDWYNKQKDIVLGVNQQRVVEKVMQMYGEKFES